MAYRMRRTERVPAISVGSTQDAPFGRCPVDSQALEASFRCHENVPGIL
jgi:hypothetical protein